MTSNNTIDAARVELLLSELRLPAIKLMWPALAARADKEGWPAARFLAALAEHETATAVAAASSGILPARDCRRARRSTPSTSTPCPWSARCRSWRSPPATAGLIRVPISCSLARPAGQEPSCGSARSGSRSERPARAVHAHHRPRPAAAGGAPGAGARGRHHQARQVPAADPRRYRLRHQGSGRDQCAVRTDRRPL